MYILEKVVEEGVKGCDNLHVKERVKDYRLRYLLVARHYLSLSGRRFRLCLSTTLKLIFP